MKPKSPYSEGSLARIFDWFIKPLVTRYKPEQMTISEFYNDYLFHSKTREIRRFDVKREFKMLGQLRAAANVKIQGIGYRMMSPGTILYVREDSTMPDVVDVHVLIRGKPEQVFCLTQIEWNRIRVNVREFVSSKRSKNE